MLLPFAGHQPKGRAEFGVQGPRGVPMDIKPAAPCRTVVREGRDENKSAHANSLPHLRDIAGSVGRRCEKMEGSSVMPNGISGLRQRRVQLRGERREVTAGGGDLEEDGLAELGERRGVSPTWKNLARRAYASTLARYVFITFQCSHNHPRA